MILNTKLVIDSCSSCGRWSNSIHGIRYNCALLQEPEATVKQLITNCPCKICIIKSMCTSRCEIFLKYTVDNPHINQQNSRFYKALYARF